MGRYVMQNGLAWRWRRSAAAGAALVVAVLVAVAPTALAQPELEDPGTGNWVSAWSAAPQGPSTLGQFGAETVSGFEYTKLAQQVVPPPPTFVDQTVRQVMQLYHGGSAARVQLSNEFGDKPATFRTVTLGSREGAQGADVVEGTLRDVTFGGATEVTVPAGERVLSDPVDLPVVALQEVVLSIYGPGVSGPATVHGNAQQTFYTAPGDQADATAGDRYVPRGVANTPYTASLTTAYYWATGIQVEGDASSRTLVTLGDSITDGFFSSGDSNRRYPDDLARRVLADPRTSNLSVTNQAISGSRVLRDGFGPKIMDRLDREVFSQPNVAGVIYLHGINDIGAAAGQLPPATADELINGYIELARTMHARNIPIYIGTLTPAGDLLKPAPYGVYSTPSAVAVRRAVNDWIRNEGPEHFDGVIDFDAALRDPVFPDHFALQYDSLDSLHPNDAGYQAMSDAIPNEILERMASS